VPKLLKRRILNKCFIIKGQKRERTLFLLGARSREKRDIRKCMQERRNA
jgi:hypothetical protein